MILTESTKDEGKRGKKCRKNYHKPNIKWPIKERLTTNHTAWRGS